MIKSFAHLHHWLETNNITKPVTVILTTDPKTADQIGWALRDELNKVTQRPAPHFNVTQRPAPPFPEPIKEGQIYGIPFKIEIRS